MCVIMHKPENVAFPEESILKNCWDNNPDMGGFMFALNDKVYIKKGYETWDSFKKALDACRKVTGDGIPYVCHFRISTQGYNAECCQPFPLSGKMNELKRRKSKCNVGVAHNGILSLTSDGGKDYSDTMKFITDYLVNIIQSYNWYENKRTVKLIENLIDGSRFCILQRDGYCERLGKGWVQDDKSGCYFSNSTYSHPSYRNVWSNNDYWKGQSYFWKDYWDNYNDDGYSVAPATTAKKESEPKEKSWNNYWDSYLLGYDFNEHFCPYSEEDDDSYCSDCLNMRKCSYVNACTSACMCAKVSNTVAKVNNTVAKQA